MSAYQEGQPRRTRGAMVRAIATAAIVSSLALLIPRTASAQHVSAPFVDQGTVTLVGDGLASDIDPASNESEFGDTVIRNIDEDLIRLAGAKLGSFEPDLATSWSHNKDYSVWTFHLRHGVRFHTGRCCMTATDVRYSLGRSVAAGLGGSYMLGRFLTAKNPLSMIKVVDPYTVQFDLGRSEPIFLGGIAQDYNAMILDSKAAQAHATKGDPWAHNYVTAHDIGTGPYVLSSWRRGQQVVMTRFADYWGGWSGKHFSKIILLNIPDSTTRREYMERGQADITFDLTPGDDDALKSNPKVDVVAPYGTEVEYIDMTEAGPLASPYARQALSYAFDYNALINGIYHGYARRSYGPIPSNVLGFDPHQFKYQTNLAEAKALLQKAGVKPGTTLTYTYIPQFPATQEGEILQAQLAQLGITVKLQALDEGAFDNIFYGTEPASKRPNLMPYSWWPDYNDPYDECVVLIDSADAGAAGANGGYYHNSEVDKLLSEMQYAPKGQLVEESYKLQDITGRQDPPAIWAAEPAQVTILAKSLKNYIFNPVELRTYYFYEMYRG